MTFMSQAFANTTVRMAYDTSLTGGSDQGVKQRAPSCSVRTPRVTADSPRSKRWGVGVPRRCCVVPPLPSPWRERTQAARKCGASCGVGRLLVEYVDLPRLTPGVI